jgi:hypothetical protein
MAVADPRMKELAYQTLVAQFENPDLGFESIADITRAQPRRTALPSPSEEFERAATPSIKPFEPTARQRLASGAQRGMEFLGMRRPKARSVAQSIFGGPSSSLPVGLGVADVVPFLGTALQTEEAVDALGRARQLAGQGEVGQAAIEGGMGILGLVPGAMGTVQAGRSLVRKAQPEPTLSASPIDEAREISSRMKDREVLYETGQEGPFLTVTNRGIEPSQQTVGGLRVYEGTAIDVRDPRRRSSIYGDEAVKTEQEVQLRLAPENNTALRVAQQLTQKNRGQDYNFDFAIEPSSYKKQSAVGVTYDLAANKAPRYSDEVFAAYRRDPEYGPMIESLGIKNYDDLVRESYKQLEKETVDQFRALPIKMSFHKQGEGNYLDSAEMIKDAHLHNHLFVFKGGDPHEFLGQVDPTTGLSSNDMFRAVHDYFGHAVKGNSFGPIGEEVAWASHSQMYSPLARIAMTSETRGQNSFVNYTPINAELVDAMKQLRKVEIDVRRAGNTAQADKIKEQIRELGSQWQYAKQASVALPPEMTKIDYSGAMPEYVRGIQGQ